MSTATMPFPETLTPQPAESAPILAPSTKEKQDFALKLRQQTIACRVRHQKLGVRKALSKPQLAKAAESFEASSNAISAVKKIIDTKDPNYQKVLRVRSQANQYWRAHSVPYPETGIRLLRKSEVDAFNVRMAELRKELEEAAAALQKEYEPLRQRAETDLGELYNGADYPPRFDTEFALDWDFPSIEPPEYLKRLHPDLYEQESKRIHARFEEAVRLTEQALLTKLHELIGHLAEKLSGDEDGKPKKFKDASISNLNSFFEEFRKLDIGSNAQLQHLVNRAQDAVKGVSADDLRAGGDVKVKVADELAKIKAAMDGMVVEKPKRAITLESDE